MKNKDTDNAVKLLIAWFIVFVGGLIIADQKNVAVGLLLSAFATITAVTIVYCDWRNGQTKNRLNFYIDDTNKRIKEVTKSNGAGKNTPHI